MFESNNDLLGMLDGSWPERIILLGNDTFGIAFNSGLRQRFTIERVRPVKIGLQRNGKEFERATRR